MNRADHEFMKLCTLLLNSCNRILRCRSTYILYLFGLWWCFFLHKPQTLISRITESNAIGWFPSLKLVQIVWLFTCKMCCHCHRSGNLNIRNPSSSTYYATGSWFVWSPASSSDLTYSPVFFGSGSLSCKAHSLHTCFFLRGLVEFSFSIKLAIYQLGFACGLYM